MGGCRAKHRFIVRPHVLLQATKLQVQEDQDPLELLRSQVETWMKHVATHEMQLGNPKHDEVFLYVQALDRRRPYKTKTTGQAARPDPSGCADRMTIVQLHSLGNDTSTTTSAFRQHLQRLIFKRVTPCALRQQQMVR